MKRLLGLLLVLGMVGCGQKTVDASKTVDRDGLVYEANSETPFTGIEVHKYENGQKKAELSYKDGKLGGPFTQWHENGQKKGKGAFKDNEPEGLWTEWYENGQTQVEATYKDGELVSATEWDEEGNEIKE